MNKDCYNCRFSHHVGNRCGYTGIGCHNYDKWIPNNATKLGMIKKMLDDIKTISCNTCRKIKEIIK